MRMSDYIIKISYSREWLNVCKSLYVDFAITIISDVNITIRWMIEDAIRHIFTRPINCWVALIDFILKPDNPTQNW